MDPLQQRPIDFGPGMVGLIVGPFRTQVTEKSENDCPGQVMNFQAVGVFLFCRGPSLRKPM